MVELIKVRKSGEFAEFAKKGEKICAELIPMGGVAKKILNILNKRFIEIYHHLLYNTNVEYCAKWMRNFYVSALHITDYTFYF